MAAFSLPKFEFISAALQGKVSREKGGGGRTSSSERVLWILFFSELFFLDTGI